SLKRTSVSRDAERSARTQALRSASRLTGVPLPPRQRLDFLRLQRPVVDADLVEVAVEVGVLAPVDPGPVALGAEAAEVGGDAAVGQRAAGLALPDAVDVQV